MHQKGAVEHCSLGPLESCAVRAARGGKPLRNITGSVKTVDTNSKPNDKNIKRWIRFMTWGKYLGCHQLPERSFFVHGYQFPVCARCTGVLIAVMIVVPLFFVYKLNIVYALLLSAIMFLDWLIQYLGIRPSTNLRRLVTGFLGGFGWTYIHLYFYQVCLTGLVKLFRMVF